MTVMTTTERTIRVTATLEIRLGQEPGLVYGELALDPAAQVALHRHLSTDTHRFSPTPAPVFLGTTEPRDGDCPVRQGAKANG